MQPKTPNLRKMQEVREYSQRIGEFVEWLSQECGMLLCEQFEVEPEVSEYDTYARCPTCNCDLDPDHLDGLIYFWPVWPNLNRLLAQFFEIDYDEAERERDALLLSLRDQQGGG